MPELITQVSSTPVRQDYALLLSILNFIRSRSTLVLYFSKMCQFILSKILVTIANLRLNR